MMNKHILSGLSLSLLMSACSVRAEEFEISDLVEGFAAEECLDYCIVGVCFWLVGCPYCHVETDAKIQHRLPDLVVTAFKEPGQSPWKEGRSAYGSFAANSLKSILGAQADGSFTIMEGGAEKSDRMFNEVHIVGNPVAYVSTAVDYLCDTESKPIPYYLSEVDALAWRDPRSEMTHIESYTPGMREIWGIGTSVYPRVGHVMQPDPPKAAATDAQRAIDIVLQTWQVPHVYIPFGFANVNPDLTVLVSDPTPDKNDNSLWTFSSDSFTDVISQLYGSISQSGTSGQTRIKGYSWLLNNIKWLEPGNEAERAWQMITPVKQKHCESFAEAPGNWSVDKQSKDYTWGWQYWRKYKCCVPHAGAYIGSVEFEPICIIGSNDY